MTDAGTSVAFVTHLYELAHRFEQRDGATTLFVRADRGSDGRRSFRLSEGGPLPTSYGEDVYHEVFTTGRDSPGRPLTRSSGGSEITASEAQLVFPPSTPEW